MANPSKPAIILVFMISIAWFAPGYAGVKGGWGLAMEQKGAGKRTERFWEQKKVDDWSPREIQLFLRDSPWAKTAKITVSIKAAGDPTESQSPPVVGAVHMMKIETCCRTFEVPVAGSNAESAADSQGGGPIDFSKGSSRTWSFSARVFWISSVSVRRAMIRQRQLHGVPMEKPEAALAPSSDLVLALSGSFLKLLEGLPSDEIKTMSNIKGARGTKRKLSPTEYIPAGQDADPMAFLIFPKTLEGRPVFTLEEGQVTFSMKGVDFKLECQFPLEPMVVDGMLDW